MSSKFFNHVDQFLKKCQTDVAIPPFLNGNIMAPLKTLQPHISKSEVLQPAMTSMVRVCVIDVYNLNNVSAKKITIGLMARL